MDDDWQLLDDYAATGSHAAFDALVRRHAPMVYGSARRRVGSADLADDVTQATFIVLARKAKSIGRRESLSAWLYRVVRYTALNALRGRSRRARHERAAARAEAMTMTPADDADLAAHLDAALDALPRGERDAVLMRFIDGRTLAEVGRRQGVAESTAQRRVERSLARLARELKRRGVAPAPAAIVAALTAWAATPAPVSATANLTALAAASASLPASTAGPVGLAKGTMKTMTMIKLKLAAAGIAAAATVGAGGVAIEQAVAQQARPTAAPAAIAPPTSAPASRDFAAQFKADWSEATLVLSKANPLWRDPGGGTRVGRQDLSISMQFEILDDANVIGVDTLQPAVSRIVDVDGNDVTSLWAGSRNDQRSYQRPRYQQRYDDAKQDFVEVRFPQLLAVPLKVSERLPRGLARVEGSVNVLTCERVRIVDLPCVASTTFTDVLPGLRLRFKTADVSGNTVRYELVAENPERGRAFDGSVTRDRPLPTSIVAAKYFVDAAGQPIEKTRRSSNPFFYSLAGGEQGTAGGSAAPAALRIEVAENLRETPVPIVLTNVELPELQTVERTLPAPLPRDLPPAERIEAALAREIAKRDARAADTGWTPAKAATIREQWRTFLAEFDRGATVPMKAEAVAGVLPDAASYDDYLGAYELRGAGANTVEVVGQASPATTRASDEPPPGLTVVVRKDERGRFIVETPEGPSPAAARRGALFGVFDDSLMVPVDALDAKGDVRLGGFWIVRVNGRTMLRVEGGRPVSYELVRKP